MSRLLHSKNEPEGWDLKTSFSKTVWLDGINLSLKAHKSNWATEVDSAHYRSEENLKNSKMSHQNERFQHDFTLHLIVTLKEEFTNNFHKRLVVLKCDAIQLRKKFRWNHYKHSSLSQHNILEASSALIQFRSLELHQVLCCTSMCCFSKFGTSWSCLEFQRN